MIGMAWVLSAIPTAVLAIDKPIAATVASLYVGRVVIVEDRVESTERRENSVRLRLGQHPQSLTVVLVLGLLDGFPPQAEEYYLGKDIRVAGRVENFRGVPEIRLRDAKLIQVGTAGAPAPAVDDEAAASRRREADELRHEIDRLRSQMREMESRLQRLEPESR